MNKGCRGIFFSCFLPVPQELQTIVFHSKEYQIVFSSSATNKHVSFAKKNYAFRNTLNLYRNIRDETHVAESDRLKLLV